MRIGRVLKSKVSKMFYTPATRERILHEIESIENGQKSNLPQKRIQQIEKWLNTGRLRMAILDKGGRVRGAARKYRLKYGPRDFVKQGFKRK